MTTPEARPLFTDEQAQQLSTLDLDQVNPLVDGEITLAEHWDQLFRKMLSMRGREMIVNYALNPLTCLEMSKPATKAYMSMPDTEWHRWRKAFLVSLGVTK